MQAWLTRRWIINFLLIALVVVLYFGGNRYLTDSEDTPGNPITKLKPTEINSVEFEFDGRRFVLTKSSHQWQLEEPVHWPANDIAVERIIAIVASETEASISVDGIDLTALGLQKPKLTLRLNHMPILFGATNNIGERRYILIGSTIFLLADVHLPFMIQGVAGLIDKRLLPPSISLQTLDLAGVELTNSEAGWRSGNNTGISTDQATQMVRNWQTAEAGSIRQFNQLVAVREKIIATLEDGSRIEFLLMMLEPELVIARPDLNLQYHFTESYFNDLFIFNQEGS